MVNRLVIWVVRSYVGGPAKSWIFTSLALRLVKLARSAMGRRPLVDVSRIRPGETIVIEQLSISHEQQMKNMKQQRRQAKRDAKREGRAARRRQTEAD